MRRYWFGAAIALCGLTSPAMADCVNPPRPWVLLDAHTSMGVVDMVDMTKDVAPACGAGSPTFVTKEQCEVALRSVIAKYHGKTHAEGNYNSYLCTDIQTWRQGQ